MSANNKPPHVEAIQVHPTLQVTNIPEAVDFYTQKMGFTPGFTWGEPPTFGAVNLGKLQVFLSQKSEGPISPSSVFFVVENSDELFEYQQSNGVQVIEAPADREYGIRDYLVRDIYGNDLVFGHYIYNMEPPIKIERVAVPVRLEKRLAAVLNDLAVHKKMSIDSTLEETLLHTFEPYGDGVASPHTQTTIRYIQELKKKHGIDYDSHGSYRFTEE
ncbi:MAG: VOC family protein [Chitinophagaceae bacterium]